MTNYVKIKKLDAASYKLSDPPPENIWFIQKSESGNYIGVMVGDTMFRFNSETGHIYKHSKRYLSKCDMPIELVNVTISFEEL